MRTGDDAVRLERRDGHLLKHPGNCAPRIRSKSKQEATGAFGTQVLRPPIRLQLPPDRDAIANFTAFFRQACHWFAYALGTQR